MLYTLSALGCDLSQPQDSGVIGAVADAVREAQAMLEREPACEAVEIFAEGRFVRDVARKPN
jgi:hypothetical protein